jgi:hypothetical protein
MKIYILLFILVSPAYAQVSTTLDSDPLKIETYSIRGGKRVGYFVPSAVVSATPKWSPDDEVEPPLKTETAVSIAKKEIATRFSKHSGFRIEDIQFRPNGWQESDCRWFYMIRFSAEKDGKRYHAGSEDLCWTILVLLDGTTPSVSTQEK